MDDKKNIKNLVLSHQTLRSNIDFSYKNVGELFIEKEKQNPGKIFIIFPGKRNDTFTFEDFGVKYRLVAKYLLRLGLKKVIDFIIFSNSSEFLFFYFAGLTLGITVVPINPDLAPEEMDILLRIANQKLCSINQGCILK